MTTPLFQENEDWTFPLLDRTYKAIEEIALNELKLNVYPNQIEIIDSEQMLESYTSVGMPNYYRHWSFGKSYESQSKQYKEGYSSLAYEIVLNCLKKGTKVFINNKGLIPIEEVSVGDKVFDGKNFVTVTHLKSSKKKTKSLKLSSGAEISATSDHIFPVVTINGKEEKKVEEIKLGDYLLSFDRAYPLSKQISYLHEFDYIPPMNGFGERFLFNPSSEIPAFMNGDLAELMGVIIGDGSMSNSIGKAFYIAVGWDSFGYEKYVKELIWKTFKIEAKIYPQKSQKYPEKDNYAVYVCSNEIKHFLDYAGLKRNFTHKNKNIPWSIWQSDVTCQARFLKGLFDTDGCIKASTNKHTGKTIFSGISFSCYNVGLGRDVHLLLNSLGISNKLKHIHNKHNNIQSIEILAGGAKRFQELIEPAVVRKKERLDLYLNVKEKYNSDQSDISKLPQFFKDKYNYKRTRRFFLRDVLLKDEDLWLHDFRPLEVVSIQESVTEDEVFDITVDSNSHLFLANNILTHNCSPTIAYLQENNSMTMQALVIAHASFGHNAVFKNNEYFTTWTQAGSIMDYLSFARNYITKCETLYGEDEVEKLIDSCHALQYHGVNTYKKKFIPRKKLGEAQVEDDSLDFNVNFSRLLDKRVIAPKSEDKMIKPKSNKDNILYFIEKNSPALPEWKKEIIRIVRTIAQYFYPQMITKVVNEGYASYTHYRIMKRLHEKGLITDGSWLEFVLSHTNVVAQSGVAYGQFRSWNPYALGFAIFQDIERICTNPTDEDREYSPGLIGQDSISATTEAMSNYNDSGFINQYLSPKVMRDFKMFSIHDKEKHGKKYLVNAVTDEVGYTAIRNSLSIQHERNYMIPNIDVVGANLHEDRKLILKYNPYRERALSVKTKSDMIEHLKNLWGYDVVID